MPVTAAIPTTTTARPSQTSQFIAEAASRREPGVLGCSIAAAAQRIAARHSASSAAARTVSSRGLSKEGSGPPLARAESDARPAISIHRRRTCQHPRDRAANDPRRRSGQVGGRTGRVDRPHGRPARNLNEGRVWLRLHLGRSLSSLSELRRESVKFHEATNGRRSFEAVLDLGIRHRGHRSHRIQYCGHVSHTPHTVA